MKRVKLITPLILCFCLAVCSGCLSSRIYPGGMEPYVVKPESTRYEKLGTGEGIASSFLLFWIFPVTPDPDINRAVSEAVSSRGGDGLIDVRWWKERKIYITGTVTIIHVRGEVIKYLHDEKAR